MSTTNLNNSDSLQVSKHPQYTEIDPLWDQMIDTSIGEHRIKEQGIIYLPKTDQQETAGTLGETFYQAYKEKSIFYDYVKKTQQDALGLLHKDPIVFSVPPKIDNYINRISNDGDNAQTFMRRIHEQQLLTGRTGLLLDIDENSEFISILYCAKRITNWDSENTTPRWIILDESDYEIDKSTMNYTWKNKFILLALNESDQYFIVRFTNWDPTYLKGDEDVAEYPQYKGQLLNQIPFTFCNASSILSDVELPPLLPLSNITLSLYRGSADYRQALHMQAQATFFLKGFTNSELEYITTGANSYIATTEKEADAKFIEIGGAGLSEMRESQSDLKSVAANLGVDLMDKNAVESGSAINTRMTIRTANLRTIAETSAAAVEEQIQYMLNWMNTPTEEYSVIPNIDFIDETVAASELNQMYNVYAQGGMTSQDYHAWLAQKDLTETTYEDWMKEIENTSGITGLI